MKKLLSILSLFCSFTVLTTAAEKELEVKFADNIQLDGILNEKAWANAATAEGFTTFNGAPAEEKTSFKVLQDKFGLYFGFIVEDKEIKSEKRINGPVWFDDSIEIFISPVENFSSDKNIREYFHFVLNPDASRFNNRSNGGILGDWKSQWSVACQKIPGGWTAEVYLPFFPYSGSEAVNWRFNIGRSHWSSKYPKPQHSVWAPSKGFHNPDDYAKLKNIRFDRSYYAAKITDLEFKQQKLCGNIEQAGQRKLTLEIELYRQNERQHIARLIKQTTGKFAIPMPIAPGEWEVAVILEDGENIVHYQTKRLFFSDSPVEVQLINPAYRNTVFPDDKPEFSAQIKFDDNLKTAEFKLQDKLGKTLQSKVLNASGILTFALKDLPEGSYKVIGPKQNIPLKIVKSANYVKLDNQKRCVINGKLFYPRGFMACQKKSIPLLKKYNYNLAHFYTLHRQSIEEITEMLDYAHKHNIMVTLSPFWQNRTTGLQGLRKMNKNTVRTFVQTIKKHPAFFGWYLFDEPRGQAFINDLQKYYLLLKEWDPEHPVIGVDNSAQNCLGLLKHSDILSLDMYPSPDIKNHLDLSIASVTASCNMVAREKTDGAFWYTPQAFSRESYPSPAHFVRPRGLNIPEIRASVYGSIAAGANGQLPFKIGDQDLPVGSADKNAGIFNSEDMKKGYLDILGNEFKAMEAVLLGDALPLKGSGLMRAWRCGKTDWILLVNPDVNSCTVTFEYPGKLFNAANRQELPAGSKTLRLQPYEVVWLTSEPAVSN